MNIKPETANPILLAKSGETNAVRTCAGAEARWRAADRSRGRPEAAECGGSVYTR